MPRCVSVLRSNTGMKPVAYLMISGALTAYRATEFVTGLRDQFERVITVQTPNARQLISPRDLARIPGNNVVESYFDERILPRPAPGPVLWAPCNFNTLNKLAAGIADNLALSITHEMLGHGQPVTVALSLNAPLFAHPIVRQSITTLTTWGMQVIEPVASKDDLTMAPTPAILAVVATR
jgi:phosphopantothenoylcysteine synthetase/decarboxylase